MAFVTPSFFAAQISRDVVDATLPSHAIPEKSVFISSLVIIDLIFWATLLSSFRGVLLRLQEKKSVFLSSILQFLEKCLEKAMQPLRKL